jgi:hypothetical protein
MGPLLHMLNRIERVNGVDRPSAQDEAALGRQTQMGGITTAIYKRIKGIRVQMSGAAGVL